MNFLDVLEVLGYIWLGVIFIFPIIYLIIGKIQDKKYKKETQNIINSLPISEEMKQEMTDIMKESGVL